MNPLFDMENREMIRIDRIGAAAAVLMVTGTGAVLADGHELTFQLVVHSIDMKVVEAPDAKGHILGTGNFKGVAVFADGDIADKTFVFSFDETDGVGTGHGYSTYTFVDGSSITARFDDVSGGDSPGGDYEVLSGTGRFEGATGTGWYKAADHPWDGASFYDGAFSLDLP